MYIGIDVGGTTIKTGVVNENGDIVAKHVVYTPRNDNDAFCEAVKESIYGAIETAGIEKEEIKAFGMGFPGIVDREKGILVEAENIGCEYVPIKDYLQENIASVPVYVDNDANCAALGEYYSSTNKSDNFLFITLGTGIGGGVIINKKLYIGTNGAAGEIGHVVTHAGGRECNCGRRGCWERYGSVTGLIETTIEHKDEIKDFPEGERITGRTVFDLARKGNKDAERVRDIWIEDVAVGVVDMINIFQPDEIVIGGAISAEGETLIAPIREYARKYAFGADTIGIPEISASTIGGDAGIIGAAFLGK